MYNRVYARARTNASKKSAHAHISLALVGPGSGSLQTTPITSAVNTACPDCLLGCRERHDERKGERAWEGRGVLSCDVEGEVALAVLGVRGVGGVDDLE